MRFQSIVPEALRPAYDVFGFSPGVKSGNRVIISGQIGANPDLTIPEALEDEVRQAFRYIELILTEAGATFDDVLNMTSYHRGVALTEAASVFGRVKAEFMSEPHCAWSTVGVDELLLPGARLEVTVEAEIAG